MTPEPPFQLLGFSSNFLSRFYFLPSHRVTPFKWVVHTRSHTVHPCVHTSVEPSRHKQISCDAKYLNSLEVAGMLNTWGRFWVGQWNFYMSKIWFRMSKKKGTFISLSFSHYLLWKRCSDLEKEKLPRWFAVRTISANGIRKSTWREVVEGICVWWVCEDHPALVWRRIHTLQNKLRRCLAYQSLNSQSTRKERDLPPRSQEDLVCSTPCRPRRLLSDFPCRLGNLSIMQTKCWVTGTKAARM